MSEKHLKILDTISAVLLLLWLALCFSHLIFKQHITIFLVDVGAWIAFGLAFLLSGLSRWLYELTDKEVIGPFRLWLAAGMVALIFCLASSFIASPKMETVSLQLSNPDISLQDRATLTSTQGRVRSFSVQFLCIRALLALGLALGVKKLRTQ
jgi:hypothetical protein